MYRVQLNHQLFILIEIIEEKKTDSVILLRYSTVNLIVAPGGVVVFACTSIVFFIVNIFE